MTEKNKKIMIITLATISSVFLLSFLTLLAGTKYYTNKSIPTQYYLSQSLSGSDSETVSQLVEKANLQLTQKNIKFHVGEERKDIFLEEFQPKFSNDLVTSKVKYYQGTPTIVQVLRDIFTFEKIQPAYEIQEPTVSKVLIDKFDSLYKAENPYFISLDSVKPEQKGVLPDSGKVLTALEAKAPSSIEIETIADEPTIGIDAIEEYKDNIAFLSENPLEIQYNDKEFTLSLFDNLSKVKFSGTNEDLKANLDQDFLTDYIHYTIQPEVKEDPTPLVLTYSEEAEKVEFGEDFQQGLDVDKEALLADLNSALTNSFLQQTKQVVQVPTKPIEAPLEISPELKARGVKELIGTGYTTFRGSTWNRIHNINVGVDTYNGMIIPQGEEFSFNENLGPVNGAAGYRPELVIKSFGTIPEYGGGLCQVSSTMYRAALFSGLDITERSNHSYAVNYYAQVLGHGLDATIYPGVKDLKFKNNTDGDIVIHAFTNGTEATFNFYGTKLVDKVELVDYQNSNYRRPGPQTVKVDASLPAGTVKTLDNPVTGFNSYWKRVIHFKDGDVKEEDILSNYRAVNSKLLVSPDYYSSQVSTTTSEETPAQEGSSDS